MTKPESPLQTSLFSQLREHKKRDEILDALEVARSALIKEARKAAEALDIANGSVTSTEVFARLRALGFGAELDKVDPRFMGAVFRKGRGWRRIRYEPIGSHGRPVARWTRGR